jgi:hypothetical protein
MKHPAQSIQHFSHSHKMRVPHPRRVFVFATRVGRLFINERDALALVLFCLFLSACLSAFAQTPPASVPGPAAHALYTIAGTVVNLVTGDPVPYASVAVLSSANSRAIESVVAGEDGRFSLPGLPAAKYQLTASKRGYRTSFYEQHENYLSGIVTGDDQQTGDLVFHLSPGASLHVEVTDEAGEPVEKATIQIFQRTREAGVGERVVEALRGLSDDTGATDFFNLEPGKYFVAVTAEPWYALHGSSTRSAATGTPPKTNPALDVVYPLTFFDGVTDESSATPIVLAAGGREQIAIHLTPLPALHLYVPIPKDGQEANPHVELQRTVFGMKSSSGSAYPDQVRDGIAEFTGVSPGHYQLLQGDPPHIVEIDAASSQQISANGGVATVPVHLSLRCDTRAALPEPLNVSLDWADADHPREPLLAAAVEDGFIFDAVSPGTWKLRVEYDTETENRVLPVASISAGGPPHTGNLVAVKDHALSLAAEVALTATRIEGFARKDGKGLAGIMIVLVPRNPAASDDLFRRDQSDSDGSFALVDAAPGNYTLVAIQDGWDLDWAKPQALSRFLPQGIPVTVTGSSGKLIRLSQPVPVQALAPDH